MRLSFPTSIARVGCVEIRGIQQVEELHALESHNDRLSRSHTLSSDDTQSVSPCDLKAIQSRTAIVVPCKDEDLGFILDVWRAIPANSLIVLVSASNPDSFILEREALAKFCNRSKREGMAVHQRDPQVAEALRRAGMPELVSDHADGLVRKGKGEAMIIGIALAAAARGPAGTHAGPKSTQRDRNGSGHDESRETFRCDNGCARNTMDGNVQLYCSGQKDGDDTSCEASHGRFEPRENIQPSKGSDAPGYYKYIGFIDADNFVPGSVEEYCTAFSAGLHLAQAEDAMVRIRWASKPKLEDGKLHFKESGRSSQVVNCWLNQLLKTLDANIETVRDDSEEENVDGLICTGNAGEHAMTMSLALKLRLASGYAIEPFHFLDLFERFSGSKDPPSPRDLDNAQGEIASHCTSAAALSSPILGRFPESPVSTSPITSPAQSPMERSPILSASGGSTSLTSPSILPVDVDTVSKEQQFLPPPIICHQAITGCEAGFTPPPSSSTMFPNPSVQILQIRTINHHFHECRGDEHIMSMWKQGLSSIYHSPVAQKLIQYRDDLRCAIFDGGKRTGKRAGLGDYSTPATSCMTSATIARPCSAGENEMPTVASAPANWQPEACRIYPPVGRMKLHQMRRQLECQAGTFWSSSADREGADRGFDPVDVLGIGPGFSLDRRSEGDVAGFIADADAGGGI